jgi:uroporphyrinogen-III synthase
LIQPIQILSTKSLPEGEVRRLKQSRLCLHQFAFIDIHIKVEDGAIQKAKEIFDKAGKNTLFVFTSVNALRFIYYAKKYLRNDLRLIAVACIDGVTLQNSLNFFYHKNIVIKAANATKLAEEISKSTYNHVVHFCGNINLGEVQDALAVVNKKVERFVVYETKAMEHEITVPYDAVLFFSVGAVQSFYAANEPNEDIVCFAIGNTTASEIKKYHNHPIIVSKKPSQQELVSMVINHFQERK